ncbi:MAG: TolC family protein [Polyangiales bacterium]
MRFLAFVLVLLATTARAQDGVQEQELFVRWLKNSPEVASWRTQVGSARFDVLSAKLWPNPELQLYGNFVASGVPPDGRQNVGAQLNAPLPVFGQRSSAIRAAQEMVSIAELNVIAQLWDRATEIGGAMVERAYAEATVEMLHTNEQELQRIQSVIELRAKAGANSQYDVLRTKTAAGTMTAALRNARIELGRAESNLLALIADASLQSAAVGRAGLAAFRGPDDQATLTEIALGRRPDLLLAQRGVRAFDAQAESYRKGAIPVPSVQVGAYQTYQQRGFQLMAGVEMPFPITNRNQGLIGRARSDRRGQELLRDALATRVRNEVAGAYAARRDARAALEVFRVQSLSAATELLKRAEVSYQAGSFSIAELFDAYETMWDARAQELVLERQHSDAEAALERAAALLPLGD